MRRIYQSLIIFAVFLSACSKEDNAVNATEFGEKVLSCKSGAFLVMFESQGVWSVGSDADWIHVDERSYKDQAAFEIRYDSNESTIGDHRFCRLGHVVVTADNGSWRSVMTVRQDGLAPYMSIEGASVPTEAGTYSLALETNLTDKERDAVTFSSDAAWISGISLGRDGKSVLMDISAGSGRSGNLTMTFTDAWGRGHSASATVNQ